MVAPTKRRVAGLENGIAERFSSDFYSRILLYLNYLCGFMSVQMCSRQTGYLELSLQNKFLK